MIAHESISDMAYNFNCHIERTSQGHSQSHKNVKVVVSRMV